MKPNHIKIAVATTAAVMVDLIRTNRINRKRCNANLEYAHLLEHENEQLREALEAAEKRNAYMGRMMDEHNVPITQFDVIVCQDLTNLI